MSNRPSLGPKFHVLLTSYETVLNDRAAFRGLKFEVGVGMSATRM